MSFSARMKQVRTAEELDALMMEVRLHGSRNWTVAIARRRVPRKLWPALDAHFGEDGLILGSPPSEYNATDGRALERISIVSLIRTLNAELASARSQAAIDHDELVLRHRSTTFHRREEHDVDAAAGNEPRISTTAVRRAEFEDTEARASGQYLAQEAAQGVGESSESSARERRRRHFARRPEPQDLSSPVRSPAERWSQMVEVDEILEANSHNFVDGWCSRCGTRREAILKWGYSCDPAK